MSTTPRKPEHADYTEAIKGADPRFTITRHLTGYAYARNGNTHNPTPQYVYLLKVDGRVVEQNNRKRFLVHAARSEYAHEYFEEVAR